MYVWLCFRPASGYYKSYCVSSIPVAWQLTSQSFLANAVSRATSDSLTKQQLSKYPPDRLVIDSSTAQYIVGWAPDSSLTPIRLNKTIQKQNTICRIITGVKKLRVRVTQCPPFIQTNWMSRNKEHDLE